ncbi:MAG: histidinol-phosphate aminotransferase family protein [Candidatus Omnitrophica bacterium]|nr:histidinol-phosphate aminotransferase family protein [Candidatus Omnitrophota bacterium]MDE2232127.1 histidinol-phosphate aminotransferase family protein [Candidatus Omnitrophota bacterium]
MIEPRSMLKNISRAPSNTEERIGKVMRLDHNERTTSLPQQVLDAIWKTIKPEEVVAYPALESTYKKLAAFVGMPREQLLMTYGSDTAIRMVFDTYLEPGQEVVFLQPTYGMFAVYTDMFGGKKVPIGYNEDFSLPVERVLEKIGAATKLVIIANPNHTGTAMRDKDIETVVRKAAEFNCLVLVDEAYHHFYTGTVVPMVDRYDNLIIVRTFSKAFGIAPLRVGYIISQTQNINNLIKVKLTHDITSVSAKFMEYLLDHPQVMRDCVRDVEEGKAVIKSEFEKLGCRMLPSVTNFVFVKLAAGIGAAKLVKELEARNVWIKGPFKGAPVDGFIRITVGPAAQMKDFMHHVCEVLSIGER